MGIQVNMSKARDIWRDKWREARSSLLEDLDVEFMRATESADQAKQTEVAAKKQELRDVTTTDIDSLDNPDDLKLVWPDCLGDKPNNL